MSESVRAGLSAPLERLAKGLALGDLVLVLLDLYVHRGRHLSPAVSNGADALVPSRTCNWLRLVL